MSTYYDCLDDPTFNVKYHNMINRVGAIAHLAKKVLILNTILSDVIYYDSLLGERLVSFGLICVPPCQPTKTSDVDVPG
jgi:hypothetical protein